MFLQKSAGIYWLYLVSYTLNSVPERTFYFTFAKQYSASSVFIMTLAAEAYLGYFEIRNILGINRIYHGVEASTRKSQASFQIIRLMREPSMRLII